MRDSLLLQVASRSKRTTEAILKVEESNKELATRFN